mgnify:CR=1 FL=1
MATAKSAAASKSAKKPTAKSTKPRAAAKAAAKPAVKSKAGPKSAGVKAKPAAKTKSAATVKKAAPAKNTVAAKAKTAKAKTAKAKTAKPAKPASAAKPSKKAAAKSAPAKSGAAKPKTAAKSKAEDLHGFTVRDFVVYPSHGVGQISGVETHDIGDVSLRVFVVVFDKEKMTLRVPIDKANSSGMRRLSSAQKMEQAISTLKGRARTRRVMWSRRAQEYDAKLNSGDPVSIAEVVRDLHRDEGQPDQSYSERQMYEAALERLAREFAAVENTDTEQAAEKLESVLRAA